MMFAMFPGQKFLGTWTPHLEPWCLVSYFLKVHYNKVGSGGGGGGGTHAQRHHPVLIPIFFTIKMMGIRNTMAAGGSN